ncbi:hypothetical protein EHQ68_12715 [Leptospira congkakensis]|uniref:Uncharacterized protein n=1 Tax=Leptospira congkakensis TaxID=2484932 RepID=A0A4Z1A5C3_9LEPT|nr:hypothetical protein [Leptospira congkakensis]TGL87399.1 hypothetical protein EHQ68_12715 [Leptospira congkakensis]TGL92968.1 hypothetical protein EHQ69_07315 [Leptospira congkakensis]TGL93247.1 hypothetical protein EHQ70_18050 [Leptospira congkakensis]
MNQILRDNIRNVYRSLFSQIPSLTRPKREFQVRNFNVIESWIDEEIKKAGTHTEIASRICQIILTREPFCVANLKMAFTIAYLYLQTISKESLNPISIPSTAPSFTIAEISEIVKHWIR